MDIKAIINNAIKVGHTTVYPIEKFTIEELDHLSRLAKENNISLKIQTEYSNFYQGTLVTVQRNWDTVEEELKEQESNFEIRVFNHKNNKVAYKKLTKYQAVKINRILDLKWS
ncbi:MULTISPECIES: hypothetical protein [Clostridium]|uniref:Uncharacterized protein n=1 Tax=Clostridium novyi B str. ATCC 27606 TaxID=1443123 RepID=A0AA40M1T9_CLONO|nr:MULTISPECIES: hypothetical protein [Clostridium]KEI11480.1 hypothetical protein Z959_p0045 [Clostridium novyi B str. ATCC 27606]KLU74249.1 hypothetical protein CBC3_p0249 [Clostridium botulinum V891]MCD3234304.1 hypothetical protein [Clostridium botulinum D/C]MCD3240288.1 hypothetical protein [Clostridium botulinum D/C]MCD3267723.1 hypothetical protein [Clostridium botulinum D/C]